MKTDYSNPLIFGKNQTERIVCVEPTDDGLVLFKETPTGIEYEVLDNKFWLITNQPVSSKQFELSGAQHYKHIAVFNNLKDKMNARQIVKNNKVDYWDIFNPQEQSLVYHGLTYFKGLNPKDVSILFFDIETTGLTHDENSKVLLISNTYRKGDKIVKKLFAFDEYKSFKKMLEAWIDWVNEMDPSILCNHNILGFDLPYIAHCAKLNKVSLNLGRDGSRVKFEPYVSNFRVDGNMDIEYHNAHVFGREIVDTMFLARKYDIGKKYESYKLKTIIKQENLEKANRTFYDADQIRFKYMIPEEWKKIKAYAIDDADDAMSLFDLMVPAFFYFTQSVSKTFQQMINSATGSQINNIMIRSYLQEGHSIAKADEPYYFEGAISFGVPGIYRNAFKQDVSSLYPSIIRQFQIYNKQKDPKQNFLKMVEYFTLERLKNKELAKQTKNNYYKDLEQSQKIGINSCYGALGAAGLNYNYISGADEVTRRGREILSKAIQYATNKDVTYWQEMAKE